MSGIYGYKEKDIINLYEYLQKNKKKSLTEIFCGYAAEYGKSKGTVRNLYYAMAKKGREDENFKKTFLGGKDLKVNKVEQFGKTEEQELISKITDLKEQGLSVRKAVCALSGGDIKLALRFQNKYRNTVKVQKAESATETVKKIVPEEYFEKLKAAINGMAERLILREHQENKFLKEKIKHLTEQNRKLSELLGGNKDGALEFFTDENNMGSLVN